MVESLAGRLQEGKNVAIHCRQGVGRAGLIAASVLTLGGDGAEQILQALTKARRCVVPETPEQRKWVEEFARTKQGNKPRGRLNEVRSHREAILQLAQKYHIRRVRLFGSAAKGEDLPASDVDVLVDFEPGSSLLDQVGFEQDLAELLGCPVDVVAEGGISPYLEQRILKRSIDRLKDATVLPLPHT